MLTRWLSRTISSREALENWKMIQHFHLGRKGVWEWLVVDQPICLRWLFQRQQCMKHPTSRTRRRPISWRSLEGTGFFWYNHRWHVPPSASATISKPSILWLRIQSKHQRVTLRQIWNCNHLIREISPPLPTNLNSNNSNNLQQKAMMSAEMKP